MWVGCALGVGLRLLLYAAGVSTYLEEHLELNTPMTSHVRLKECLFLLDAGASPYPGDTCHHPPLILWALLPLHRALPSVWLVAFLAAVDLATAVLLQCVAAQYATARTSAGRLWADAQVRLPPLAELPESPADGAPPPAAARGAAGLQVVSPTFVALLYFLNPLTVASCVAMSLQNIQHLAMVAAIALAGAGRGGAAAAALAAVLYVCPVTPVVLVLPCAFLAYTRRSQACGETGPAAGGARRPQEELYVEYKRSKDGQVVEFRFLLYFARFLVALLALFGCLIGASLAAMGGEPHFLGACFASVLMVSDLTPNVGLFWYIFIEVFDRFRQLFLVVFHGHLLFHSWPLHFRVGRHLPVGPWLHCFAAIGIIALFKPYPTAADHALMLAALLIPSELVKESDKSFVFLLVGQFFGLSMFPTMRAVWLGRNAGNANFLYNMTLVTVVFGSLLLSGWVKAGIQIRRRQHLHAFCRQIVHAAVDDLFAAAGGVGAARTAADAACRADGEAQAARGRGEAAEAPAPAESSGLRRRH